MVVLCAYDDQDCIDKAKTYFFNWKEKNIMYGIFLLIKILKFKDRFRIPSNFKSVVYQTAIKYGSEDDWYYLFEKAKVTSSNSEQVRMFTALASTRDYNLLKL
jgi:hypothetical protein